ncbi:MAG: hypothetical protein ABIK79_05045 [Chloroflexota bacterium]
MNKGFMQAKKDAKRGWSSGMPWSNHACFWIVFLVHVSIALIYKEIIGLNIEADPARNTWDWYWQTLPIEALRFNLLESIWNLHSQPPLYNLYGAFFARIFYPNHLQAMHYSNIILGSLLSGMMYGIVLQFTQNRRLSFLTALALALNPALFLYEAYPLYTLLAAFLLVLTLFCLALFSLGKRCRYLYAFVLGLNLLIMTRSLDHVVILLVGIPIACVLAGWNWRKVLVGSIIISSLSVGWYGKNYVKFGFFGGSSWSGLGLWKAVVLNYPEAEIEALVEEGVVEPAVADLYPFSLPSRFAEYGFNQTSEIDVLSRDDFNNINIIAISKMYQRSAFRLIAHDPVHYLQNVYGAYRTYSCPSSTYQYLSYNAAKIHLHEAISSLIIHGHWLTTRLNSWLGRDPFCSLLFFYLPASLLIYAVAAVRRCGKSLREWVQYVRTDGVMMFSAFMIAYTTFVSCALEYGESVRFKFLIESILWAFIVGVAYRCVRQVWQGRASRSGG